MQIGWRGETSLRSVQGQKGTRMSGNEGLQDNCSAGPCKQTRGGIQDSNCHISLPRLLFLGCIMCLIVKKSCQSINSQILPLIFKCCVVLYDHFFIDLDTQRAMNHQVWHNFSVNFALAHSCDIVTLVALSYYQKLPEARERVCMCICMHLPLTSVVQSEKRLNEYFPSICFHEFYI